MTKTIVSTISFPDRPYITFGDDVVSAVSRCSAACVSTVSGICSAWPPALRGAASILSDCRSAKPCKDADGSPHPRPLGQRGVVLQRRAPVDLAPRGIRQHHPGHGADVQSRGNRKAPGLDHLAGVLTDHRGTEDRATPAGHHLDHAAGPPFGTGAVVLGVWPSHDADAAMAPPRLGFGQPDMVEPGVGKRHLWDDVRIDPRGKPEHGDPDHEAGMIAGNVGELMLADDIADGVDAPVRRAKRPVHLDAGRRIPDASCL